MSDETRFPEFEEAQRRRADLHHALVDVEDAASGPAAGRESEWAREVVSALGELRETIEEHIEGTEKPGGLYDEILSRAPRLAGAVNRAREDHPVLREGVSEMIAKLRTANFEPSWSVDDAREDIGRLLGRVVRHRQHGADLIWEAYNLDIGGID
jgi:hypothetical protein